MIITRILEKLFGLQAEEVQLCESCETLKSQLAITNEQNRQLLRSLLELTNPKPAAPVETKEIQPITNKYVPWRVRQQMLEEADRAKAAIIRRREDEIADIKKQSEIIKIEELEQELGVNNAGL